jgi:hypothetical protein
VPDPLTAIPARRGARVVVLAGAGAARSGRGMRVLAGITGATVVNTVGVKGLFAWDDPLHGGTVGLQQGDAELAEIPTADLVVTTGFDDRESASLAAAVAARRAAGGETVDVDPAHLALAAGGWPPAAGPGARPPFYEAVSAVAGPLYQAEGSAPWAAARLARSLPEGGLVVAPPGPTGFWLGRTFPTSTPGSVVVADDAPSIALAAAGSGRPVTLVAPAAIDLPGVTVELWPSEMTHGPPLDALIQVAGPPDPAIWPDPPS